MKNIYKIVLLSIFNSSFLILNSFSQTAPVIQWQNTIGGNHNDQLFSVQQCTDGGYILGGNSVSNISGDKTEDTIGGYDYWVIKLDGAGSIQWQNTIGGSLGENLFSIQQTTDGGYILGGISNSNISGDKTENNWDTSLYPTPDYWLVKLDTAGNIAWQNTIGGTASDMLQSVQQTTDGGYILGGYSSSSISGDKTENAIASASFCCYPDYWVVKVDSVGNIQWQNTIGGDSSDFLQSIYQTFDGGYILGGWTVSNISGDKTENCQGHTDYWVVKLDSLGNIQWQNTIGGSYEDELYSIMQTTDGGYILGGWSISDSSGDKTENSMGNEDYWVIKLDSIGNIQWQNTIGGNYVEELHSVKQTIDGGYILGGWSWSPISGDKTENSWGDTDYWIIKLDSIGNILWQNDIGGIYGDGLYSVCQTNDGGYFLGGTSGSIVSGDKTETCFGGADYWVIKLGPDTFTSITQLPNYQFPISISPNPVTEKLNVNVNNNELSEIILYDITGRKLLQQKFLNSITLNTKQLAKGIYLYEVRNKNGVIKKGKVVKE
ncbi:MAG: T9SS type A sorting domain-containing protein [Bacteroidia bacterium]